MCMGGDSGYTPPSASDNQFAIDQTNLNDDDFKKKYNAPRGTLLADFKASQRQDDTLLGSGYGGGE